MTIDPKQPATNGGRDDASLTGRIGRATGRLALRPVRAVRMPASGVGATAAGDELDFAIRKGLPGRGLPIAEPELNPPVALATVTGAGTTS